MEEVRRIKMPRKEDLELLGVITNRVGGTQIMVLAEDGIERNCRIPGKMQKKIWMRADDVVIIKLWDFQKSKADVIWRYTPAQADYLRRKGIIDRILEKMENQ
ncbi:MAG: translation initiation factor eIF-1A [Candidatus Diapherotrites archaeon]|nr:translation initiation factor eIF-1A [Candidatus Diapherotrites archaeon]